MTTAPRRFVVHALPGDHGRNLAKALASIATGGSADPVSLDEAAQHLANDPVHRLGILYVDPVRVICTAMTDGQDLEQVVEAWTARARAALILHRRNRKRSMIFEAAHFQRYAATALDRLDIKADSQALGMITDTDQPPTPLHYLVARSALDEMAAAKAVAEELYASTQILSNDERLGSETLALEAYQDLQHKIRDAEELHARMEALRAKLDSVTKQSARNSTAKDQMELEMASQRQAQKVILDTTSRKLAETADALAARETALSDAQAHIEHIMNSRSMRLTRPLRAVLSFIRGGR